MRIRSDAVIRHLRSLPLSILAWSLAFGLFVLLRIVGVESTFDWVPTGLTTFYMWLIGSVLFGAIYWLVTIVTESRAFRTRSYGLLILVRSLAMLVAVVVFLVLRGWVLMVVSELTFAGAMRQMQVVMAHPVFLLFLLYTFIIAASLSFARQTAVMVGPRVLMNLLLGKYHQPKTETRIFMFVDLEGSTTHAERLGHEIFCRLIQECFRDLTDSAIRHDVEIYQYVGDEAILTWAPKHGFRNCNCLRVFFEFGRTLKKRDAFYRENFGFLPVFKAGANLGEVTVAEIGVLKRDIAYLSDVLNTAARLEGMCLEHDARLLITDALRKFLPAVQDFNYQQVGELSLRGKSELVDVYRVEEQSVT